MTVAARYRRNRAAITRALGSDPGTIVAIETGWGDPHRGGQTVARVTFDSGHRLAYKPRSVKPELFWAHAVAVVEDRLGLGLRAPRVCDRGRHGWVDWIEPDRTRIASPREFRRLGALIGLLDLLEVRDAHPDNFVTSHGQMILVDAETVGHPRLPGFADTPSIVLTGALPWPPGTRKPAILSGLAGGKAGEAAIVSGFRAVYRLVRHRAGILGLLARTRVVLRDTRVYAAALRRGTVDLPPVPGIPEGSASRRILAAEERALARGDIPLFEAEGRNLRDESRIIVPGFFERSGRETIAARLRRLGPKDVRDSVSLLRSCLRLERAGFQPPLKTQSRVGVAGKGE